MMRALSFARLLGCLMLVQGCQPEAVWIEGPESVPEPVAPTLPEKIPDCPGGEIVVGLAGPTCAKPTPDAGKACTKASDCSGACLGETMTCSAVTPLFGCNEVVMADGQKAALCVD